MDDRQGSFDEIPIIDVSPLFDQSESGLRKVAAEISDVYSNVGFGYISNHNIPQELIDGIFEASRQFHALPSEEKLKIEINEFHRGFIPINTSTTRTSSVDKVTKPNQSESFMMMHELTPDDPDVQAGAPLAGPNQWPESLPGFREAVKAYHDALVGLGRRLVQAMAVALGQDAQFLDPHFERPTSFLRLLYYPPQSPQSPDDLFGSAPHTDYGFITILLQDDAGGLQVRNSQDEWVEAPPIPGTFVMNSGDILHRWSNGRFISTPHRVINRSGRARYSNPFFFDPDMHSEIVPLPATIAAGTTARYEPVVYGEYLMAKLNTNHDQHRTREAKTQA